MSLYVSSEGMTTYQGKKGTYSSVKKHRKRMAKKTNKKMAKVAKQVIASEAEPKRAYTSTGNSLIKFNSGIDSVGDLIQILPGIGQGSGESQRDGNRITARSFNIRGYLKLDINDVDDSTKLPNVAARLMVVSMKVTPSYQDAQTLASKLGTLLKKGATTTAFAGNLQDLFAPINTDVFTVHYDKVHYLRQDYLNVIGATPPSQRVSADISKTVKFFNINVKCKNRKLLYDEDVGSDTLPVNFGPFLLLGYSYLDGSTPDIVDTKLGLCFDSTFTYLDF